jgi:hypothetical protein
MVKSTNISKNEFFVNYNIFFLLVVASVFPVIASDKGEKKALLPIITTVQQMTIFDTTGGKQGEMTVEKKLEEADYFTRVKKFEDCTKSVYTVCSTKHKKNELVVKAELEGNKSGLYVLPIKRIRMHYDNKSLNALYSEINGKNGKKKGYCFSVNKKNEETPDFVIKLTEENIKNILNEKSFFVTLWWYLNASVYTIGLLTIIGSCMLLHEKYSSVLLS